MDPNSEQGLAPTAYGRDLYPPNGYYAEGEYGQEFPCTCQEECGHGCKGVQCKCAACHASYMDYLSCE